MNAVQLADYCRTKAEHLLRTADLATHEELDGFDVYPNYDGYLCVGVYSLRELSRARAALRSVMDGWSDKLIGVYGAGSGAMVAEYGAGGDCIYMYFDPTDPPPGLLKEGCRIERGVAESVTYSVVCDTGPAG